MTALERELAAQRRRLLAIERHADAELIGSYGRLYRKLRRRLSALTVQIEEARNQGIDPSAGWLAQQRRYRELVDDLERESLRFATGAATTVTRSQRTAVGAAEGHAQALTVAAAGPAPRAYVVELGARLGGLPAGAFEQLVGNASDGRPLSLLLAELHLDNVQNVTDTLTHGVAVGKNPRVIARDFRAASGVSLTRALTIARTEVLKAHTTAALSVYRENAGVVAGFQWWATLDTRTCAACWAMHGTLLDHGDDLDRHPNCRCAAVPRTRSWEELGFEGVPDDRPPVTTGAELFARLPERDQRAILGGAKFDAYTEGLIDLPDLVARPNDPRWGTMRREATLAEALA